MKKLLFFLGFIAFATLASAQTVTLSGTQNKGTAGKNAELKSTPVKITKTMKITSVSGECEGFWIVKDNVTIHTFYDNKKPVGTQLKPGTYYVYPNLKKNSNSASVTLSLQ
ncbi:MAG: hypothetical protein LT105_03195 [Lentimicrobium sp.]|nr:hypothetical protein [Lentimicrobium sp.]